MVLIPLRVTLLFGLEHRQEQWERSLVLIPLRVTLLFGPYENDPVGGMPTSLNPS